MVLLGAAGCPTSIDVEADAASGSSTGESTTTGVTTSTSVTGNTTDGTGVTTTGTTTDGSTGETTGDGTTGGSTSDTDGSTAGTDASTSETTGGTDGTTGETTSGGTDGATTGTTGTTGDGTTGTTGMMTTGTTGEPECVQQACGNAVYECGDCIDNDSDGTIDGFDFECISPCDDDESSFATGVPGDNLDLCHQDCFFDGNSGAGDDGCNWWLACDPLDPDEGECHLPPGQSCPDSQPQECIDNCQVPNGCDCFGCCTINVGGQPMNILVGAEGCALDNLAACPECTPVDSCANPCDPDDCELCFGEDELPPECDGPTCPEGVTPCEDAQDCAQAEYCQTGCCEPLPS